MKAKILLVEDNEQNRYLATFLLEQRGYQVVHAETGPRGLELAASERPDLILLDIQLPVMDGHAVTRALRANPALKLVPIVADADVVLDCSDNFVTRQAINAACVRHGKPLVSGAAIRFDAQISVFDPRDATCLCYACIFAPDADFEETRCATLGVFAPLVGIVGAMQAAEALKLLAGVGPSLAGRLLMLDARNMQWDEVRAGRDPACPICGGRLQQPK